MTPADMGRAFSYLFAYRTCSTHPEGRRRRDGEAQVAGILTSEISGYQDFEAFLNAQGFTMRSYEQGAIGVAARGQVFVMARRCTDEQAPYIDSGWVFERMRDRRGTEPLEHVVVWAAQLWATMQWFFYTRLDRGIDAVGRFKEAFVNVSQLTRELQDQSRVTYPVYEGLRRYTEREGHPERHEQREPEPHVEAAVQRDRRRRFGGVGVRGRQCDPQVSERGDHGGDRGDGDQRVLAGCGCSFEHFHLGDEPTGERDPGLGEHEEHEQAAEDRVPEGKAAVAADGVVGVALQ